MLFSGSVAPSVPALKEPSVLCRRSAIPRVLFTDEDFSFALDAVPDTVEKAEQDHVMPDDKALIDLLPGENMLKLFNVSKKFNPGTITEKAALNNINLDLADGDFVTVIGGNGGCKSTLLNLIEGVHNADTGSIFLDGMNLT